MKLTELAFHVNGEVKGDAEKKIDSVASISRARENSLTFFVKNRAVGDLRNTKAGVVLLTPEFSEQCECNRIVVDDPYAAFAKVARLLHPHPSVVSGIHASAIVSDSAEIAATASIGPLCVVGNNTVIGERVMLGAHCAIGANVTIGDDSRLHDRITICSDSVIGQRCEIMPGVVIGGDGFGYAEDDGKWLKIPQLGRVVIGDDVDIGANTTIDRAALDDTSIGDGVKLDNQIQIAHNVQIGEHTIMAGCTAVAGSASIGKRCRFGGHASILGQLEIVDDVYVNATSVVTRSIKTAGIYSSAIAVQENNRWQKVAGRLHRLNELAERVHKLEKQILVNQAQENQTLENQASGQQSGE
ncbi:MAG: UDP-3-O-(3-hydroxymyristoyl)glucosamine N-acyltransferase [Gammaproteobacteria bacterium]|nr:UDP-3-O-(3-hydroxymyristoyl)glucosamine N-acyltransferase [Gammaproteobacteria bacterium]